MPLHRVLVTKREQTTIYVESETSREAEEAALELCDDVSWYEGELDVEDIEVVDSVPETDRFWMGGEDGHWVGD